MKIISLNTWGGIGGTPALLEFFKMHRDADIFCLQEIFHGGEDDPEEMVGKAENKEYRLFDLIQEALPDHIAFFRPHLKDYHGLAIFVKMGIEVLEEGERFVHKHKGHTPEVLGFHARNIQYVKLMYKEKELCIINFHGLWTGNGKTDTEERILQSKNIVEFTKSLSSDFLLCGDFNLLPDTESMKMIEDTGLRNLITEYGITSTRTFHYTRTDLYADYAFTTPGIVVTDFKVLPDEVSDHSPLYIEIE